MLFKNLKLQKLQKFNANKHIRTTDCMSVERIQNELKAGVLSSFVMFLTTKIWFNNVVLTQEIT